MEDMIVLSAPSWALHGTEQDFTLGAKAPACPPAATFSIQNTFDLPEWMESRENLGLGHLQFPDNSCFTTSPPAQGGLAFTNSLSPMDEEEDYTFAIHPDDMLVPLSELQPASSPDVPSLQTSNEIQSDEVLVPCSQLKGFPTIAQEDLFTIQPQQSSPSLLSFEVATPKPQVIKCKKQVVKNIPNQKPAAAQVFQIPDNQPVQFQSIPVQSIKYAPQFGTQELVVESSSPRESVSSIQKMHVTVPQVSDAEELINEMVQIIGTEINIESFANSTIMEDHIDDLLDTLESCKSPAPSEVLVPVSPPPLPSPVPSVGSLSPSQYTKDSFLSLPSPLPSGDTFQALPSPVPSVGYLSPPQSVGESQSSVLSPYSDNQSLGSPCDSGEENDELEAHSYSQSPRKRRCTQKARSKPYTGERKERKKEQNKQAALRYRQKKKQEEHEFLQQIQEQEERQKQLKTKYSNLKQEVKCLKKIMREVFIARGIIKEDMLKKLKK